MIAQHTRNQVEKYWSEEFHCPIEALHATPTTILSRNSANAFIFHYPPATLYHVPANHVDTASQQLRNEPNPFTPATISRVFGNAVQQILHCSIAYCDAVTPNPNLPKSRQLDSTEHDAVDDLAARCEPEAWEHGGINLTTHPTIFGCFVKDKLVAAAAYEIWGNSLAHISLITDPNCRNQGFGKSVAHAATQYALAINLIPQWRTLITNTASLAVARSLGFEELAQHYLVRLNDAPTVARSPRP